MWLFVGLGNPGRDHAMNRHNIGFMAVDALASIHGFGAWRQAKPSAVVAEGRVGAEKVLAVKPLTFMNRSGDAVGPLAQFYKIPPERIVVLHDELDLAQGRLRVKRGGGNGGHNGLRSIDQHLGPDYWRVRLGIGHPGDKARVTGHVLGNFASADRDWVGALIGAVAEAAPLLLAGDAPGFATKVHVLAPPPDAPGDRSEGAHA